MHRRQKALMPVKCEGVKRLLCGASVKASLGSPKGERVKEINARLKLGYNTSHDASSGPAAFSGVAKTMFIFTGFTYISMAKLSCTVHTRGRC